VRNLFVVLVSPIKRFAATSFTGAFVHLRLNYPDLRLKMYDITIYDKHIK
jgi:hypothetical protein